MNLSRCLLCLPALVAVVSCSGTTELNPAPQPLTQDGAEEGSIDAAAEALPDVLADTSLDAPQDQHTEPLPEASPDAPEEPAACSNPEVLYAKEELSLDVRIDLSAYTQKKYTVHEVIEVMAPKDGSSLTLFGEAFKFAATSTPHEYDGHRATFCLAPFKAGDTLHVEVDYDVAESKLGQEGFGLHRWSNGTSRLVGPFLEPYFAPLWILVPQSMFDVDPEHDEDVAASRFALEVITPSDDWTVAGPGGTPVQQGTHFSFLLDKPTPLYACSFGAAPAYSRVSLGKTTGGMELFSVAAQSDQAQAQPRLQAGRKAASWMESHIGPYEFGPSLDIVLVPNYPGGMEHTSALWVGTELILDTDQADFVVAHETVHEWLGDSVRFSDWSHLWLTEGFTEWVTNYRVFGDIVSPAELAQRKLQYRTSGAALCNDVANGPLRFADGIDMMQQWYTMDIYYVYGAAFLQMVHARLLRDYGLSFDAVLKQWYDAKRLKEATTEEFRDFLGTVTGDAAYWTKFFNQWALSTPCPTLTFDEYAWDGANLTFKVNRSNASVQDIDDMPVVIEAGASTQTVTVSMPSGTNQATVQTALTEAPTGIKLDPDNTHVFVLKTGPIWPGPVPEIVAPEH
ncbi:MAG: hypothetical protein HY898_04035 [Deltaproteobacteria bacterium]|nr:hypothetical protein [Deltaproteobacteria bacterium]